MVTITAMRTSNVEYFVGFEILTVVTMKDTVVWSVTPFSLVDVY
jgi:hypothetical protein